MRKPKNILEALGIVDFDDDLENGVKLGQKVVSGQDCLTHKEENKTDLKGMSAEVAGIAALVKLLGAAVEAAEEDEDDEDDEEKEPEKPVKVYKAAPSKNGVKNLEELAKETYTHQEISEKFDRARREIMGGENKKNEKISLDPADIFMPKNVEAFYNGKPLKDFPFGKKRKLVLHDTVEQEAEALAQSHKKILDALSQVEPDGMDYHMIKEMVKYIDILHSVRCSAERVASILAKD